MNKAILILRHELLTTLRRRSFLLVTFGVPLALIVVLAALSLGTDVPGGGHGAAMQQGSSWSSVEGYVDHSGLVRAIPRAVPLGRLLAFATEAEAQEALAAGRIAAYYVVPANYLEQGELLYVYPDSRPLVADGQEGTMVTTLFVNLLAGDEQLAERVWNPVDLEVFDLGTAPPSGRSASNPWVRYFPALMAALFFGTFMFSSTLLSESVAGEKENRTIEVLMLSASPVQIFAGKVAGLGTAALIQISAWLSAIYVALRIGGQELGLPAQSPFSPSLLAWALLFFLLGFALYATLMAGAGALASRLKEVSQVSYLILSPLMAGYMVGILAPLADASQAALPVALSLFPLTAPVVMMMRLAAGPVPVWHLALSLGLMVVTAWVLVRTVAALFRAQYLLSGNPLSVRRLLTALRAPSS